MIKDKNILFNKKLIIYNDQAHNLIMDYNRSMAHKIIPEKFIWPYPAYCVFFACSINEWKPIAMDKFEGGFIVEIILEHGIYEYKFIVDGKWYYDITRPVIDDGYNGKNNIITILDNKVQKTARHNKLNQLNNFSSYLHENNNTFVVGSVNYNYCADPTLIILNCICGCHNNFLVHDYFFPLYGYDTETYLEGLDKNFVCKFKTIGDIIKYILEQQKLGSSLDNKNIMIFKYNEANDKYQRMYSLPEALLLYIRLSSEVLDTLKEENEELKLALYYQPGGECEKECKAHFEELQSNKVF